MGKVKEWTPSLEQRMDMQKTFQLLLKLEGVIVCFNGPGLEAVLVLCSFMIGFDFLSMPQVMCHMFPHGCQKHVAKLFNHGDVIKGYTLTAASNGTEHFKAILVSK